ncbi:hypothetical protein Fcan01_10678 [Folsomia candida]|uniref:Uncharacterized protein n=1 Tax=Folsomia candida TaxID=158441 RepID=A0A226E9K6_FOLCA|nr:hypothetical protein Fcan01_10678 [Folsomia candida]
MGVKSCQIVVYIIIASGSVTFVIARPTNPLGLDGHHPLVYHPSDLTSEIVVHAAHEISDNPGYGGGDPRFFKRPVRIERKGPNRVKVCPKHDLSRCMAQVYDVNQFNVQPRY